MFAFLIEIHIYLPRTSFLVCIDYQGQWFWLSNQITCPQADQLPTSSYHVQFSCMRLRKIFALLKSLGEKSPFSFISFKNQFANSMYVEYNLTNHAVYLTFSSRLKFRGKKNVLLLSLITQASSKLALSPVQRVVQKQLCVFT